MKPLLLFFGASLDLFDWIRSRRMVRTAMQIAGWFIGFWIIAIIGGMLALCLFL